ncbi:winged helix-turn-helix domain-containing protein [Macrococcoides caseolyticum]|uniref:winged helix-turn-helix domain-containing protein n=1 Tax=Macrococcoides caseolyticum TaxID=69966 RepID=UPI001F1FD9EB|nr:winged helix-turn-helix domain-containing protein [Macrococcus caseolyticus]MCE4956827.1 winged helix-turn-helix transcriptional regulator [Macrococcus caseolyticus]
MTQFQVNTFEQLKCISDELRMKISILLIEKEMTVTDIAKQLDIPKAKIFYHMKELEKHKMIKMTQQIPEGSNILKYYRATHNGFNINPALINSDNIHPSKKIITEQLYRTIQVLNQFGIIEDNQYLISTTQQIRINKNEVTSFKDEINQLINKYSKSIDTEDEMEGKEENLSSSYYFNLTAFEITKDIFE